ncbi:hypothetical protein DB345_09825 [Spartobacteria bacterium LR76]|nr:hypothetical protein DB345_09825 [Spartobacteria bacterium LR76]
MTPPVMKSCALIAIFSAATLVAAEPPEPYLKGGTMVLREAGPEMFSIRSPKVKVEWEDGTEAGRVMKITTSGPRPKHDSEIQLKEPLPADFSRGDVVFLRFKLRCLSTAEESGVGIMSPLIELVDEPYTKTIWARFPAQAEWTEFMVPGRVGRDYKKGELVLSLRVGYAPQVLEVKDLEVWKLPPTVELAALPFTSPPLYAGHEKNAAWRQDAEERINKYRKQDVRVIVTDEAGKPVPDAQVVLEQTRHEFGFGTAVSIRELLGNEKPADTRTYQATLLSAFDSCGTENDLKWPAWDQAQLRTRTLLGLEWLRQAGYTSIRGHVLLWPSFYANRSPARLRALAGEPAKLREVILDHVRDEVTATAPFVNEWDVINEPRLNHEILDLLGGEKFMVEVFHEARKWLPEGRLYLNEALTFTPDSRIEELERVAKLLQDNRVPIDGLGIQCHYNGWVVTPPAQIVETLDRLAKLGLSIRVTEFDIDTMDSEFQAKYLADFYTAVFSHPAVRGIQMWGFWEGRHWKASAALWTRDWTPRPAARAYLDLVRGKWWTQSVGKTDGAGTWVERGFKGDYRVTTWIGERVADVREVTLGTEPLDVKVKISSETKLTNN